MEDEEVQPFCPVTTKLNGPPTVVVGFCTAVGVNPAGPVHAYVTLVAVELPFKVIVGKVQVRVSPRIPDPGVIVSRFTTAVACAVQALALLVTTKTYEPGVETVGFGAAETNPFGPTQPIVTFGVTELPVIVTLLVKQLSVPPVALAFGMPESGVTTAVAVAVQPLVAIEVRV